ncbi:MAG: aldo/keto reductase [Chloroflexota bacterium]
MRYRLLGATGLSVSTLCLGTVYFGSFVPPDESLRIVHRALDLGVSFVDTAEIYMRPKYNASEEVVGRALAGRRSEVILATKKRYDPRQLRTGGPGDHGMARRQIVAAIEGSLRRLRTDYLDLYYSHQPDPETPLDEMLGAFDDLVRAGKVRYVGLSNYPAWRVVEALWAAERRRLAPVSCVQVLYNLLDRSVERETGPACQQHCLGLVAYSPLAGGVLTGKYGASAEQLPPDSRAARVGRSAGGRPGHIPVLSERNLAVARRLSAFAEARGETAARLAIAWALHQPAVSSVIMGASTVGQLEANVAAAELDLDARAVDALSALASR